jgi:hypothetical protein
MVNYLRLATIALDAGKEAEGCEYLGRYLVMHPDFLAGRAQHAELLLKLHRLPEARTEFERFVMAAQDNAIRPGQIIHAYSRLMEIASAQDNAYLEHLNRGIGLYLLARRRAEFGDAGGELSATGLLWKAAFELKLAHEASPQESRPCWYLYSAYWLMGQAPLAERWLVRARDRARFAPLYPAEERALYFAGQYREKRL